MVFSIITHLMMICIILAFLARVFWGVSINTSLQLSHPRIYTFQVWVDVFALLLSATVISFTIHPKIAAWIESAENLKTYFMRSFKSFIKGIGCMFLLLIISAPILYFMFDAPTGQGQDVYVSYIETAFG